VPPAGNSGIRRTIELHSTKSYEGLLLLSEKEEVPDLEMNLELM